MSKEAVGESTSTVGARQGVLASWRQLPRPVKALLAGVMISKLASFMVLFLIMFLTHRGFSARQASFALGLWGAGVAVGPFVGGWLSDRLNARTTVLISMFGAAGLIISIVYVRAYAQLLLVAFAEGAVNQLYRPASQSLIAELTPRGQQVLVTSMYTLCFNVGIIVAPLIGGVLWGISYDLLFWTEGLAMLAFGVIALLALPRSSGAVASRPAPEVRKRAGGGYRGVLADRRYMTFLGGFLLLSILECQYTVVLPLSIRHAGLSVFWFTAVVSLNGIISASCQLPATRFTQKWPLLRVQLIGFGLLPLAYCIYAIAMVPVVLIIGTLVWTIADVLGVPTMFAYPGTIGPASLRGRYFAAFQGVNGLGRTIAPPLGVMLLSQFGQQAFLCLAGIGILATVIGQIGLRRPAAAKPSPEPAAAEPVAS